MGKSNDKQKNSNKKKNLEKENGKKNCRMKY